MIYRRLQQHHVNTFNREHIEISVQHSDDETKTLYQIMTRLSNQTIDRVVDLQFHQGEAEPNGITIEALIAIVIDRLEEFQVGLFKCRENALAITKLEEALHWLQARSDKVKRLKEP